MPTPEMNEWLPRLTEWLANPAFLFGMAGLALLVLLRSHTRSVLWLRQGGTRVLAAMGGLMVANILLEPVGFHIGFNPWNIAILAGLGLPGLGLLVFLHQGITF